MKFRLLSYKELSNKKDLYVQYHTQRKKIFIDQLKWKGLRKKQGLEIDDYDHEKTWYVLGIAENDRIYCSMRLNPTTRPFLTKDVFEHLVDDKKHLESSSGLYETSRLFNIDPNKSDLVGPSRRSTVELFAATIQSCLFLNAEQVITVTNLDVEKRYDAANWCVKRKGKTHANQDSRIVCGKQKTNVEVLNQVHTLLGYETRLYV